MATAFRDWSALAYGAPGAEETLLALQDAHGLNVVLLLWCVWIAARFGEPDEAAMRRAMMVADEWETGVVAPIRRVRRLLKSKPAVDALRAQVKAVELAAEAELQSALEALAALHLRPAADGDAAARARRTLAAYARLAEAPKTPGFSVCLLEKVASLTVPRLTSKS